MLISLLPLIASFTISVAIVAGLIGLVRYQQLPASLRWLAWLAGFEAAMNVVSIGVVRVLHLKGNLFLLPFILGGELTLLALAYRQALQSVAFSRVLPWLLGLFGAYALLESVLQLGRLRHVVPLELIYYLAELSLAGLYFQKILNELRAERLRRAPFFWLSVALMLHGLGASLIALSSNYILAHLSLPMQRLLLWGLLNVFNILRYLAYCFALWVRPQPAAPAPS